jgi:polyisoprenyl-teichoic acid--peptidoglycan teichoic acid transferase
MSAKYEIPDDMAETSPCHPDRGLEAFQPIYLPRPTVSPSPQKHHSPKGFFCLRIIGLSLLAFVLVYFFFPFHTNILFLGVDSGLQRGDLGRTDTIVLTTVSPLKPYIGILSIPRDLWVEIPGIGENRINTAYYFAEAAEQGSGFEAIKQTIRENFEVRADYYVVLHMDGLIDVVDAMNGVDIILSEPMAGYEAGVKYHFDGRKALAFARSRTGSDDFSRMSHGQILLKSAFQKLLKPGTWLQIPDLWMVIPRLVETNVPVWQWPRLGLAVLRAGVDGIDARVISREMVAPFVTERGAQVLAPRWDTIRPLTEEMFRSWW